MKVLIFHNRSAGSGETSAEDLIGAFRENGIEARYATRKPGPLDLDALADVETIVVAGGDGTFVQAVQDFHDFRGRFTIVPLGGANNIAASVGIGGASAGAVARGLRAGRVQQFRLGLVTSSAARQLFVEGIGCGALAKSLASANDKKSQGDKVRAGRDEFAAALDDAGPIRSRVSVDGEDLPGDILFAEVLNLAITGPSLRLAPSATPEDELLDVAFLPAVRREAFRQALLEDRPLPVEILRGRSIDIVWNRDRLRIDDHFPQPPIGERRLGIALSERGVEVIVPADVNGGSDG